MTEHITGAADGPLAEEFDALHAAILKALGGDRANFAQRVGIVNGILGARESVAALERRAAGLEAALADLWGAFDRMNADYRACLDYCGHRGECSSGSGSGPCWYEARLAELEVAMPAWN